MTTMLDFDDILGDIWSQKYSGDWPKLTLMGPAAMRGTFSAPLARKRLGLRARAYRLGKKRPWWSGGGYPMATARLAIDRLPKIKDPGYGLDISKYKSDDQIDALSGALGLLMGKEKAGLLRPPVPTTAR